MILRRHDRHQRLHAFARRRLAVERRRAENIATQTEQFAVHDFGVKDIIAFLESSNGSHDEFMILRFTIYDRRRSLPGKIVNR